MNKFSLLVICCLISVSSHAIIIRHDKNDVKYIELAKKQTQSMAYLEMCAGTVIDRYWVITAAHCVSPTGDFPLHVKHLGIKYPVEKIVIHPDAVGSQNLDIALLALTWPLQNAIVVNLYKGDDELNKEVVFVGKGKTGTGLTGDKIRDKVERAATNTVKSVEQNWLTFTFNEPETATEFEGVSGIEDSGGPAFLIEKNKIFLLGVGCCQEPVVGDDGLELQGGYNSTEYYSRISSHSVWIEEQLASRNDTKSIPHPVVRALEHNDVKAVLELMVADTSWLSQPKLVEQILLNVFYRKPIIFVQQLFATFPLLMKEKIHNLPLPAYAYMQGNGELFSLLVSNGAKLDHKGFKGQGYVSLLTWQYFNDDYQDLVKLLIKTGFNINEQDQRGDAAIHLAGFLGWPERIKFLVANGANINLADNKGRTVLMDMARKGNVELATILLSLGADIDLLDKEGKTALMIAKENKNESLIVMIENLH
ncbi:MAG: hypothetical protein ACI9LM_001930 [Alteromonadaceae bacterium]|jgi:hypothetical protein